MTVFDEHRGYLRDTHRLAAYARAIDATVRVGDVVIDLGAGTGILGLMACRAGARRVYAIDDGSVLAVARAMSASNELEMRITYLKSHSTRAELPERADVVLADQMGPMGIEAGLLECFADARARLLTPSGRCVPSALDVILAPVDARAPGLEPLPTIAGFDASVIEQWAASEVRTIALDARDVIGAPSLGRRFVLGEPYAAHSKLTAELVIDRAGRLAGVAAWFDAELAPGISVTNSPFVAERIDRKNALFPLSPPIDVSRDDRVEVTIDVRPRDAVSRWQVRVTTAAGVVTKRDRSTLDGPLFSLDDLRRTHPKRTPRRGPAADARLLVLTLCDGTHPLDEIERDLHARHASLFRSRAEAAAFVAKIVERDLES